MITLNPSSGVRMMVVQLNRVNVPPHLRLNSVVTWMLIGSVPPITVLSLDVIIGMTCSMDARIGLSGMVLLVTSMVEPQPTWQDIWVAISDKIQDVG